MHDVAYGFFHIQANPCNLILTAISVNNWLLTLYLLRKMAIVGSIQIINMRMKIMKSYLINLTILAAAMGVSATYVSAEGGVNDWQSQIVRDFNQLDTSGNGLLLRNEASKNNAFTKKTFEQADVNRDNYIDVDEYIYFKTGSRPTIQDKINPTAQNQAEPMQAEPMQMEPAMEEQVEPTMEDVMEMDNDNVSMLFDGSTKHQKKLYI